MEAGREAIEREFTRRQARSFAEIYEEIKESIAAVAKAKRLSYVVKVSTRPLSGSDPNEVTTALGRSVLYADRGSGWQEAAAAEAARLAGELRGVAVAG